MTRGRSTALALFTAVALSVFSIGCDALPASCDRDPEDNPPIRYVDGTVKGDVYTSSPDTGPLLDFPGGIRYRIVHHLGKTPRFVEAYLSFGQYGVNDSTLAQAAGNQVEIEDQNDQTILVTNGACAEYWLLVVASIGDDQPTP